MTTTAVAEQLELEVTLSSDAVARLRRETVGVRLATWRMPTTARVTGEQRAQMAAQFGADAEAVLATKRLLNTKHTRVKKVTRALGRVKSHWQRWTVPYEVDGVRLLPRGRVTEWDSEFQTLLAGLAAAVAELEEVFQTEILPEAQLALAELYDPSDYLTTLAGAWGATREFCDIEPPNYLQQLNPALYRECEERVMARLSATVERAERGFEEQMARLLESLVEALADPGKKVNQRTFTALERFFERYRTLQFATGSSRLDQLFTVVREATQGVVAKELRQDADRQERLRATAQQALEQLSLAIEERGRNVRFGTDDEDEE